MKRRPWIAAPSIVLALGGAGCATVIHGSSQKIEVVTEPPGAAILLLPAGRTHTSPTTLELPRIRAHTLRIELPGYQRETVYIDRLGSGALYGNILLGGLIGMSFDMSSGGAFVLSPKRVQLELRPIDTQAPSEAESAAP